MRTIIGSIHSPKPILGLLAIVVTAIAVEAASPVGAATSQAANPRLSKPVVAFYYSWFHPDTFMVSKMSDMPVQAYESSSARTIRRQVQEAGSSGINVFAASWTGPGTQENANLRRLLAYAPRYEKQSGNPFQAAIYLESDLLSNYGQSVPGAIRYAIDHYLSNPSYFSWHGKPVLFIWDPLGQGRTLAWWSDVRRQLDPKHREIWMVDSSRPYDSWLGPFDGFFVFSALYWCLPPRADDIATCDQTFRDGVTAFNKAHGTDKIWAAPVQPGYNDIRLRGPAVGYIVPRVGGLTYRLSWQGAIKSSPDWVMITTFNEWFEGTMIEPSITYHNLYLTLTKKYASQWRAA